MFGSFTWTPVHILRSYPSHSDGYVYLRGCCGYEEADHVLVFWCYFLTYRVPLTSAVS
jgi:hypothetical protein